MVESDMFRYDLFGQAIDRVAKDRFYKELREALVHGPQIFVDIFAEYERLCKEETQNQINIDE